MHLRSLMTSAAVAAGVALAIAPGVCAQNQTATAPPAHSQSAAPSAPVPDHPAVNPDHPFPAVNPANFTAVSPTQETVDQFLHATWGYDANRIWQVEAILKTPVEGVSKVVVLVSEKGQAKPKVGQLVFFTLPDGKHIISNEVLPFGAKPYEHNRELLEGRASGPSMGGGAKSLELVEFADFECPHCKEAEPTIKKLLADYPTAHFVFQNFPLTEIHPEAFKAAAYGHCVAELSGSETFFKFSDAIFATQEGLTPTAADETLKNAVTKAGADPAKVAACSAQPATTAAVKASLQLGKDLEVNGTPTLFVNGFPVSVAGVPYPVLQKIVEFEAKEAGLALPAPPLRLTTP